MQNYVKEIFVFKVSDHFAASVSKDLRLKMTKKFKNSNFLNVFEDILC